MDNCEKNFFQRIVELLERGEKFMICRVIRAVGSAPRNAGAQMLVFPDGQIEFTLGGGAVEGRAIREAVLSMDLDSQRICEYHLKDLGMHCGGLMTIAYERAKLGDLEFYKKVAEFLMRRTPVVLGYQLNKSDFEELPKAMFTFDGESFGQTSLLQEMGNEAIAFLESDAPSLWKDDLFFHKIYPPPRLLIFGAGHVGAKLAELAAATGIFDVDIVDDREAFADSTKLPFADRVIQAAHNYEGPLPLPDSQTFVAVITRCHATDKVVLSTLLDSDAPFAYLGMIGSVPKKAQLFKILKDEGVSQAKLDQVTTPMGLPIGGKHPGEIAISMLAEMIQRKNDVKGDAQWKHRQRVQLKT